MRQARYRSTHSTPPLGRLRLILLLLAMATTVSACAPRGSFNMAKAATGSREVVVYAVRFRDDVPEGEEIGWKRPETLVYERITIAVPPLHQPGHIEWPGYEKLNPQKHFVTTKRSTFSGRKAFSQEIHRAARRSKGEVLFYVHGYNTNHAEAAHRIAQISADYDVPAPAVLFSWPSAGHPLGYAYDRDSTLIARDRLESTLLHLSEGSEHLFVVAHSMGAHLLMETLRQMWHKGHRDLRQRISGVVLMSPDIDPEVFRTQITPIKQPPRPFVIFAAKQDQALRVSASLTGREQRLGSLADPDALSGLPVTLIDISNLADGRALDHQVAASSKAAIRALRNMIARIGGGRQLPHAALVLKPTP